MRFELIKEIVSRYQHNDRVKFSIQTNATLITSEKAQYFKEYQLGVGVSIDGPQDIHDKWRVYGGSKPRGSFKQVERGLRLCKEFGVRVGIYAVVTRDTLHHLPRIAEMLRDLEIFSFAVESMAKIGRGGVHSTYEPTPTEFFEAKKELIDWLIQHNESAPPEQRMSERTTKWMLYNIRHKSRGFMCLSAPCGAGVNHIGVSTKGEVYICDNFLGDPKFIVGNVHADIPLENQVLEHAVTDQFLQRLASKLPFCNTCNLRTICSQGCPAISYFNTGDLYTQPPMCEFYKQIYPYLIAKLGQGIPAEFIS